MAHIRDDRGFIREKLEKAGFGDIHVEYKDFLLPNTPKALIKPVIAAGKIIERAPLINKVSQSIFITARI